MLMFYFFYLIVIPPTFLLLDIFFFATYILSFSIGTVARRFTFFTRGAFCIIHVYTIYPS